jgi:hypothetical protein
VAGFTRSNLAAARTRFLQIADDYTFLNPHLSLVVNWFGEETRTAATDPAWRKWQAADPTSPHWYTPETFERLVCGYIADDGDRGRDRTVRELVAEFNGLTGTAKQKLVLAQTDLARVGLSAWRNGDGPDRERVAGPLTAMRGIPGPSSRRPWASSAGTTWPGDWRPSVASRIRSTTARSPTRPTVSRTSWRPPSPGAPGAEKRGTGRRLVTGVNWSPGIANPFRHLGGVGRSLDSVLQQQRAGHDEPVVMALHMACPQVRYTDRGKSAVVIHFQADRAES